MALDWYKTVERVDTSWYDERYIKVYIICTVKHKKIQQRKYLISKLHVMSEPYELALAYKVKKLTPLKYMTNVIDIPSDQFTDI